MEINSEEIEIFEEYPIRVSIPQKSKCKECPFSRKSERGATTYAPERKGTFHGASGVLSSVGAGNPDVKFPCHLNTTKICEGHRRMRVNLEEAGKHKDCFDTYNELQDHHVFKKGSYNV